jgi:hypothetical protein
VDADFHLRASICSHRQQANKKVGTNQEQKCQAINYQRETTDF